MAQKKKGAKERFREVLPQMEQLLECMKRDAGWEDEHGIKKDIQGLRRYCDYVEYGTPKRLG